jgi:hypothetical protein
VFVALGVQYAMRMRHIVNVACPSVQCFSTLSHIRPNFRKKVFQHKVCVLISVQLLSEISHSKNN